MSRHHIATRELVQAQLTLFAAIGLQAVIWRIHDSLFFGPQVIIIPVEVILAIILIFTGKRLSQQKWGLHRAFTITLLGIISFANISSLVTVLHSLIVSHSPIGGTELLISALAIFITNIIIFALWYWEIDSPGLSGSHWSKHDRDFQFTQQEKTKDFPGWQPEFLDYLYLSVTNAINFAPADARPITHQSKVLMGVQALVAVFTLALVLARSVSILGQG